MTPLARPAAAALVMVPVGWLGCQSGPVECSCAPPGVTVDVPPESAAAVTEIKLSGVACASAKQSCAQQASLGGCVSIAIVPEAAGSCHIDVFFATGTVFSADLSIVQTSGCCSGYYADPPASGQIDVPAPPLVDGGADESNASDANTQAD